MSQSADAIATKRVSPFSASASTLWLAGLALVIVGALLYYPSLPAPFYLDDYSQIKDQAKVQTLWPPMDWRRPVGVYTLQLGHALHGQQVEGYRLFNIGLHLVNASLLLLLIRGTLRLPGISPGYANRATSIAFAAALLWLVHPLQTNAVTYIWQRLEALMAGFFLLVLVSTLRSATVKSAPAKTAWQIFAFVAFSLGVGTKEVIAVCPVVLLIYHRLFLAGSWRETFLPLKWLLLAMLLPLVWLIWSLRGIADPADYYNTNFGNQHATSWQYLQSQATIICHYLRLAVWPDPLVLDYGWKIEQNPWKIYPQGLLLLSLLAIGCGGLWKNQRWAFLILAFFLVLAPTSSILPVTDLAFEHRMYLPLACVMVGLVLVAATLLDLLTSQPLFRQILAALLLAGIAGSLGYRTWLRNQDYLDTERFYAKNVVDAPGSPRAHLTYAQQILLPKFLQLQQTPTANLQQLVVLGDQIQAEVKLVLELAPQEPSVYALAADWEAVKGNFSGALKHYAQSLQLDPKQSAIWYRQAEIYAETLQFPQAIDSAKEAARLQPKNPQRQAEVEELLAKIKAFHRSGLAPPLPGGSP